MAEEIANGNGAAPEAPLKKVSQFLSLTPYLCIDAPKAADAIEWYKEVFDFELVTKMYHEKRKAEQEEPLLMHAHLKNGALELMLSDDISGEGYLRPPSQLNGSSFSIAVFCTDADSVIEEAVKKGATVTMEVKDQFWGARYGKFKDPFGFEWAISGELKESPVEKKEVEDAVKISVPTEN